MPVSMLECCAARAVDTLTILLSTTPTVVASCACIEFPPLSSIMRSTSPATPEAPTSEAVKFPLATTTTRSPFPATTTSPTSAAVKSVSTPTMVLSATPATTLLVVGCRTTADLISRSAIPVSIVED